MKKIVDREPKWLAWSEESGKNALHYLCGADITKQPRIEKTSLAMLQFLLKKGMDINAVHRIDDNNCYFPATPLWYAYTRGKNKTLYTYLLKNNAYPDNCMFAIAWNDDVEAATLFKKHGAKIDNAAFLAAVVWKRFNMVKWFLLNGADVNFKGIDDYPALLVAVKRKYPIEMIGLLLEFGPDFNLQNQQGISPKKLAELNRQKKILKLFAEHDLKMNKSQGNQVDVEI